MADYEQLKLSNQLCFPLYVCSKEVVRRYKPFLDELDLTYTQYITMMAMWEHRQLTAKELGDILYLDSGTLTPVLKTLEKKGFVARQRSQDDERSLVVTLTDEGWQLQDKAASVPEKMGQCIDMELEDLQIMHRLLHKFMDTFIKK
ncbi:Organic hydroperoxide resistance transcriptional regulator [Anaerovibrio sp. JC8]|uniref:MarR family winged helix-turn-helix transcriptional regulator n=1 Tax=Anaerovibrio sp. JC8 TaxID=1240085 RepID=UPI000A0D0D70|nr:MarR family transcriptional regulator [Anaerovibrio sp. JC8]ORT99976.1 Organic hydroperoxide resistance transcriptional regulator [Anaerovibrio sp. JC8]